MEEKKEFTTTTVNIPEEYKPISAWGYFGYQLLFSIPCIGFILLCIFALGGTKNINLKNFARSYFCVLLLTFIIFVIFFAIAAASGITINYDKLFNNAGY
ncbi:MAG: hypothetical protein J5970_02535 [Bacilli bacterium]|nr:hypothetical protein [Bacilli bacterium]